MTKNNNIFKLLNNHKNMILKIAHRGASGIEQENTLRSFKKAIELHADMIECDVHLTKDNHAVIIHDETLNRTTNGAGPVSHYTLKQIKTFNAGRGEKIPTVQEVINLVKGKCKLNLEIKGKKPAQEVAKIISKKKAESFTIVSGNSVKALQEIKKINPKIKTALVFLATNTDIGQILFDIIARIFLPITRKVIVKRARKAKVQAISLGKTLATKRTIDYLHRNKLKVYLWTLNKKKDIIKYQSRNVDGIFSNYPDRF